MEHVPVPATQLRYAFQDAQAHKVTVLGGSGDAGATDDEADDAANFVPAVALL